MVPAVATDVEITEGLSDEDYTPVWAVAVDGPITASVMADIRSRLPEGAVRVDCETDSDGRTYMLWRVIVDPMRSASD
jgi:hypothetical protein